MTGEKNRAFPKRQVEGREDFLVWGFFDARAS
jgi:hypothetical protein